MQLSMRICITTVVAPASALADHSELLVLLLSVCKECQLSPVESELSSLKETGYPSGPTAALLRLGFWLNPGSVLTMSDLLKVAGEGALRKHNTARKVT